MKDDDVLPVSTPTFSYVSSSPYSGFYQKDHFLDASGLFGRGRYKFWALSAILLLAFWSMLTGTLSLRRSAANLNRIAEEYSSPTAENLDALDLEERGKLVRQVWDVYTNKQRNGLTRFWQDAFSAAYEDLTSDVPEVREAAISEIAKMSVRYLPFLPSSSW